MFEVIYHYHTRNEDGKYNTEETKTMTKKIGQAYDETPYEQVASAIIGQLARRDYWITDVEVYEFTKKKITFKEASDGSGIVLKNKKYSLSNGTALTTEVLEPETPVATSGQLVVPTQTVTPMVVAKPPSLDDQKRILFHVVFEPSIQHENEVKKHRLTKGKRYPVHKTTEGTIGGQKYSISDDLNRLITLDEKYFTMVGRGLIGDDEVGFSKPIGAGEPKLSYGNAYMDKVPDIRAKQYANIPIDNGQYDHLLDMPDLRKKR
jgi:hypothetical protein